MSKRELLVLAIFVVGGLWGLRSTIVASCLFIWNDIFRPLSWVRYQGVFSEDFPSNHYVTGVLVASLFLKPRRPRWNSGAGAIALCTAWIWICYLGATYKEIAYQECYAASTYMIPLVLISMWLVDRRSQLYFLYALALSVGVHLAWHGFHSLMAGRPVIDMSIRGGQMSDRNDFLVGGTAALPLIGFMAFYYEGRWRKWVRWGMRGALLLSLCAFFFSLSRGAILGLAVLTVWYAVGTGRTAKRLAIAAVLVLLILPLVPQFVWDRMATLEPSLEYQTEGSAASRLQAMRLAWEITLDHPVFGVGPDNSWAVSIDRGLKETGVEPHFFWLKCSSEYGLPMLVWFVAMIASLLWRLRRISAEARRRGDRQTEGLATMIACSIVGFLATGTFTSQFLSEYLWAIIGLAGAFLANPWAESGVGEGAVAGAVTTAAEPVRTG